MPLKTDTIPIAAGPVIRERTETPTRNASNKRQTLNILIRVRWDTGWVKIFLPRECFRWTGFPASGCLLARLPLTLTRESGSSGFRSLHGCGAAGILTPFHTSTLIFYVNNYYKRSGGLSSRIFGLQMVHLFSLSQLLDLGITLAKLVP